MGNISHSDGSYSGVSDFWGTARSSDGRTFIKDGFGNWSETTSKPVEMSNPGQAMMPTAYTPSTYTPLPSTTQQGKGDDAPARAGAAFALIIMFVFATTSKVVNFLTKWVYKKILKGDSGLFDRTMTSSGGEAFVKAVIASVLAVVPQVVLSSLIFIFIKPPYELLGVLLYITLFISLLIAIYAVWQILVFALSVAVLLPKLTVNLVRVLFQFTLQLIKLLFNYLILAGKFLLSTTKIIFYFFITITRLKVIKKAK